jgi:hypothetical protein
MEPMRMKTNSPARRLTIIHDAERFAQDEAASNSEDEPEVDDNASSESSSEDDEGAGDFVPTSKRKRKGALKVLKATGGKNYTRK